VKNVGRSDDGHLPNEHSRLLEDEAGKGIAVRTDRFQHARLPETSLKTLAVRADEKGRRSDEMVALRSADCRARETTEELRQVIINLAGNSRNKSLQEKGLEVA